MNKTYSKYIASGLSAAVIGSIALSSVAYSADTAKINHQESLMVAIAQKFNLNMDELRSFVTKWFADKKVEKQVNADQKFTSRIHAAVEAGKLTQAQANIIIAKKTEIDAFKLSLQGKTKEEIRVAVKAKMKELKQWAKDNNIPENYVMLGGGLGLKLHMGWMFNK